MKDKTTVILPKYDVEKQMQFIANLCNDVEFDARVLITLIFADWINDFQQQSMNVGFIHAFSDFLSTAEPTFNQLKKIKERIENERKDNPSC